MIYFSLMGCKENYPPAKIIEKILQGEGDEKPKSFLFVGDSVRMNV